MAGDELQRAARYCPRRRRFSGDERRQQRGGRGRRRLGDHDGDLPEVFDARELAAELALDLAEPREVAAQEGDGRGDGEVRLDQRPAAAKLGFTSARYFQRSSATGKWRPVFFSSSRTQRRQRRPKATTIATARGCWSGGRRWREKASAGRAIPATTADGT
uniref:DUF834 domain-containing protein n=1 Tax=Oryza sativa subsp. japonica TaxID=39947 RepID=Q7EYU4_ORYSJ|nr:hypothetical protein [Oryza sativa Japonica Group]